MQKMSKEDFLNLLKKNKQPKIDLLNGTIINLTYDKEEKAYRGIVEEINLNLGLWKIKTLYQIATEPGWGCKLILEDK